MAPWTGRLGSRRARVGQCWAGRGLGPRRLQSRGGTGLGEAAVPRPAGSGGSSGEGRRRGCGGRAHRRQRLAGRGRCTRSDHAGP
eukprot:2857494-Alexandrium_andersonii.AAC.1